VLAAWIFALESGSYVHFRARRDSQSEALRQACSRTVFLTISKARRRHHSRPRHRQKR